MIELFSLINRKMCLLLTLYRLAQGQEKGSVTLIGQPGLSQKLWQQAAIKNEAIPEVISSLNSTGTIEAQLQKAFPGMAFSFVARASIGAVYCLELEQKLCAVKVQHPGIKDHLLSDIRFVQRLFNIIGARLPAQIKKNFQNLATAVADQITSETDYIKEERSQKIFCEIFKQSKEIKIPQLVPGYTNEKIIISEFSDGQNLHQFLNDATLAEKEWFLSVYHRFILKSILHWGQLHADPHPGNFLIEKGDGLRLVVLDFGCVAKIPDSARKALGSIISKAGRYHEESESGALIKNLTDMGFAPEIISYYEPVLEPLIDSIVEPYTWNKTTFPAEWNWRYKVSTILASRPWEEPMLPPDYLVFIFRVYDALLAYWKKCNVGMNWNQDLMSVIGG